MDALVDNGGDIYTVFTRDDLLTHATIYWTGNAIASSIRTYANNNRYPWAPSHHRTPVIEHRPDHVRRLREPPGINSSKERIESFLASDRAAWYNHVNIAGHPNGGHFILGDPGTMDHRPGPDLQVAARPATSVNTTHSIAALTPKADGGSPRRSAART